MGRGSLADGGRGWPGLCARWGGGVERKVAGVGVGMSLVGGGGYGADARGAAGAVRTGLAGGARVGERCAG